MQSLFTNKNKAFNADLRTNKVEGVDKTHNVWTEVADMKKLTSIRGICHQEIGRLVTSTKNMSREVEFLNMSQNNDQFV